MNRKKKRQADDIYGYVITNLFKIGALRYRFSIDVDGYRNIDTDSFNRLRYEEGSFVYKEVVNEKGKVDCIDVYKIVEDSWVTIHNKKFSYDIKRWLKWVKNNYNKGEEEYLTSNDYEKGLCILDKYILDKHIGDHYEEENFIGVVYYLSFLDTVESETELSAESESELSAESESELSAESESELSAESESELSAESESELSAESESELSAESESELSAESESEPSAESESEPSVSETKAVANENSITKKSLCKQLWRWIGMLIKGGIRFFRWVIRVRYKEYKLGLSSKSKIKTSVPLDGFSRVDEYIEKRNENKWIDALDTLEYLGIDVSCVTAQKVNKSMPGDQVSQEDIIKPAIDMLKKPGWEVERLLKPSKGVIVSSKKNNWDVAKLDYVLKLKPTVKEKKVKTEIIVLEPVVLEKDIFKEEWQVSPDDEKIKFLPAVEVQVQDQMRICDYKRGLVVVFKPELGPTCLNKPPSVELLWVEENKKLQKKIKRGKTVMHSKQNMKKLDEEEILARLAELDGWEQRGDALHREFEFKDFTEAFGFMAQVACISERLFHHPEWSNVWNKVSISITNHSKGGITELDFEFAERVSALVEG